MRLLHSASLKLEELVETDAPDYAVLSHRWLKDTKQEVSFQDIHGADAKKKVGYSKLRNCGRQAAAEGLEFIWVDTCCIDKSSSAELSEAINSMFRWYKNAKVCYVYLGDVSAYDPPHPEYRTVKTLENSEWFRRGWTLQELIAPSQVVFYSKEWERIGSKTELVEYLEKITGIDARALQGVDLGIFSIASRMSWAANRNTTRVEDAAYSLLGIFDINMPMLYGEGERAFIRLQEQIMKLSDDQSIFAWKFSDPNCEPYVGLLAPSPSCFVASGNIYSLGLWSESEPFSITSKGLRTKLFLAPDDKEKGVYKVHLECTFGQRSGSKPTIFLQLVSVFDYGNQYVRVRASTLDVFESNFVRRGEHRTVHVKQDINRLFQPSRLARDLDLPSDAEFFWVRGTHDFEFSEAIPPNYWSPQGSLFYLPPSQTGRLLVTHSAGKYGSVRMSLLFKMTEGMPTCRLGDPEIVPGHFAVGSLSGFDNYAQCIVRRAARNIVFATARTSVYQAGRRIFVITLFVKTVQ